MINHQSWISILTYSQLFFNGVHECGAIALFHFEPHLREEKYFLDTRLVGHHHT